MKTAAMNDSAMNDRVNHAARMSFQAIDHKRKNIFTFFIHGMFLCFSRFLFLQRDYFNK